MNRRAVPDFFVEHMVSFMQTNGSGWAVEYDPCYSKQALNSARCVLRLRCSDEVLGLRNSSPAFPVSLQRNLTELAERRSLLAN